MSFLAQIENLLSRAVTVRDEIVEKANTANRVGSLFHDLISSLNQEFITAEGEIVTDVRDL